MQHLTPQYQHFLPKVRPVTASSTNPTRQRSLSGGSARPSRRDQPARGALARSSFKTSRPGSRTFSPARPGSASSGRSNNSAYIRPGSKSCESSTDSQRKSLQYHSKFSRSSKKREKIGLAPMFQRSLTSRSKPFLHRNYFVKNPLAYKFADVRKSGRCLWCYDNQHQADNCKLDRLPT